MANTVPNTISHQGDNGGKLTPSNNAVTIAELSFKTGNTGCWRKRMEMASVTAAVAIAMAIWYKVPTPKK